MPGVMSDTPMRPMSGSAKRVARSADPPMANARKPAFAIRRADRASCASGVTSGRSTAMTLAIDGRCKIPPDSDQYCDYTTCHGDIFRGHDPARGSNSTELHAHTYVRYRAELVIGGDNC